MRASELESSILEAARFSVHPNLNLFADASGLKNHDQRHQKILSLFSFRKTRPDPSHVRKHRSLTKSTKNQKA